MRTNETTKIEGKGRYAVAVVAGRHGLEAATWYVVDRTGRLRDRRIGTGAQGLREARWFTRLLNGLDAERAGARSA